MKPRPLHRWTGLGGHRAEGIGLELPGLPPLRACACRWVLGLRVGDLAGLADAPNAGEVLWAPRWVYEHADLGGSTER